MQQKLKVNKNYDEDLENIEFHVVDNDEYREKQKEKERERERNKRYIYERSREKIKNDDEYGDSDETISNNDL